MQGETNLNVLLNNLKPSLQKDIFVFCSISHNKFKKLNFNPICSFIEDEGITIIIQKKLAQKNNISFSCPSRLITLSVHSDLNAVGLLATITKLLSENNISVNVVSAYYHDHLFIPEDQAEKAYNLLKKL